MTVHVNMKWYAKLQIIFLKKKVVSEIIIKFKMEDPKKKYHLPIIISPNGYSIWWSQ